jgi:hypothetical protein
LSGFFLTPNTFPLLKERLVILVLLCFKIAVFRPHTVVTVTVMMGCLQVAGVFPPWDGFFKRRMLSFRSLTFEAPFSFATLRRIIRLT